MWKLITLSLGLSLGARLHAECVATAYPSGSRIPTFRVIAIENLQTLWKEYESDLGEAARLTYVGPEYSWFLPLDEQCLVSYAVEDRTLESNELEKMIVQKPCESLEIGERHRLIVFSYCVELFGRPPDFYSAVPFRHAEITRRRRY